MSVFQLHFPELGEGLHEGRIDKWLVKPGDLIKEDEAIAEVENDKSMVELPSPVDGKVLDIKVAAGRTATVGDLIMEIETDEKTPVLPSVAREVLAAPGVRQFAREQGVNITSVIGSGVHGKITRDDVEKHLVKGTLAEVKQADQGQQPQAQPIAARHEIRPANERPQQQVRQMVANDEGGQTEAPVERVPLSGTRKAIAQAMTKSMYTAPHVTLMDEADVTDLVAFRAEIKPLAALRGTKITYLPFVIKALIAALRQYPQLNATLDEERAELVQKRFYHIGIATDTDRGLLVPVVRDADRKSVLSIAAEIEDLAGRGREGRLSPQEMKGSTISISNIGSARGLFFTPIINYPEVSILGVGRITERPIVRDGQIVPAHLMALSLSFDHRVVDGVLAQNFMNEIKRLLENPRLLLLEV